LGGVAGGDERAWRDNLACAADPGKELTQWEGIADAFEAYCAKYPALPDDTRREIFQVLLMRTVVPEAHVTRFVRLKQLRPEDVRAIFQIARAEATATAP
ncbi:MAG TPA: hypothetical protein VM490_23125, partial [Armatimonadaceae bacterium]|nr:hypothetical protein [Armatimonadaceae bacterium]